MGDVIFCSVAFGNRYLDQQRRLEESIRAIYPDARLLFFRGRLPDTSREFHESLYGFKVHAIAEASQICPKVIWLDPAMILTGPIDRLYYHSVVAVKDESKLHQSISEIFLDYIDISRKKVKEFDWHLVGGSLYYFDFDKVSAIQIFEMWANFEKGGWFGSQQQQASEQINSHRNDESCMAVAMYLHEVYPVTPEEVGYCVEKDASFQKKHFK